MSAHGHFGSHERLLESSKTIAVSRELLKFIRVSMMTKDQDVRFSLFKVFKCAEVSPMLGRQLFGSHTKSQNRDAPSLSRFFVVFLEGG